MKSITIPPLPIPLKISAALWVSVASALAGSPKDGIIETPPLPSGWEFRTELYGWLCGIDGTTGVNGLTADVSADFGSIIDNINMAAALQFEARNGRWGIVADGMYVDLGDSGNSPGPLYKDVDVGFKQFMGELDATYRIYESPRGFVDVYGGIRYTGVSLDLSANVDDAGVQNVSDTVGANVTAGIQQRATAIVASKKSEFQTATAARRTEIEQEVTDAIKAEAEQGIKRDLLKELKGVGDGLPKILRLNLKKAEYAIKRQRAELARSTAELKVAQLRASVDSSKQKQVSRARARVQKAQVNLSKAVDDELGDQLPVGGSADKNWVDPIIGLRAQWNINERWFLAARGDVGGFGVSSDFMWSMQGTVGYNFTEKVSAELGYRYLHTDYTDGGFVYDLAQLGIYTGLNIRF